MGGQLMKSLGDSAHKMPYGTGFGRPLGSNPIATFLRGPRPGTGTGGKQAQRLLSAKWGDFKFSLHPRV